jgi:hypothetical protein
MFAKISREGIERSHSNCCPVHRWLRDERMYTGQTSHRSCRPRCAPPRPAREFSGRILMEPWAAGTSLACHPEHQHTVDTSAYQWGRRRRRRHCRCRNHRSHHRLGLLEYRHRSGYVPARHKYPRRRERLNTSMACHASATQTGHTQE